MIVLFPAGITNLPFYSTLGRCIVVEMLKNVEKMKKNVPIYLHFCIPYSETVNFLQSLR